MKKFYMRKYVWLGGEIPPRNTDNHAKAEIKFNSNFVIWFRKIIYFSLFISESKRERWENNLLFGISNRYNIYKGSLVIIFENFVWAKLQILFFKIW